MILQGQHRTTQTVQLVAQHTFEWWLSTDGQLFEFWVLEGSWPCVPLEHPLLSQIEKGPLQCSKLQRGYVPLKKKPQHLKGALIPQIWANVSKYSRVMALLPSAFHPALENVLISHIIWRWCHTWSYTCYIWSKYYLDWIQGRGLKPDELPAADLGFCKVKGR